MPRKEPEAAKPQSVKRFLDSAAAELAALGVESARREARLLLAEALGESESAVFARPERALSEAEAVRAGALLARRLGGEPLSRIRGRREFWSLSFRIGPATLDPRPDSETLVEAVLEALPDRDAPLRLLDFGTGSGCLLLALLSELPRAEGLGIDLDAAAVEIASANAQDLGLSGRARFQVGDWGRGLSESFDVVLSNPPYIETADLARLEEAVREHDPRLALDGGADGLAAYRALLPDARRLLVPGGLLALEIGWTQAQALQNALHEMDFGAPWLKRDLAGRDRCLLARATP